MVEKQKSLAAKRPKLISEWHSKNNGELTPWNVTAFSGKKVWWKCKYGHEWMAAIYHRSYGCGCPICASERKTSFAEQAIWFYLKQLTIAENRFTGMGKEHVDEAKIKYYSENYA